MDIKKLLELAQDAGINMRDEDGYHDCVKPWVKGMLADPAEMIDVFFDFISELGEESKRGKFDEIIKFAERIHSNTDSQKAKYISDDLSLSLGINSTMNTAFLGQAIYEVLIAETRKHVEKYAEEWFRDCVAYLADMEEGQREDYEYERARDRRLEE